MMRIKKPNEVSGNWQNFLELNLFPNSGASVGGTPLIDLIKYPIITEKSYLALFKNQQYTFDVDLRLSKPQIKKVFENLFNVDVIAVNTHIPPRKNLRVGTTQGYRARYKRAILTLKKGQSLIFSIPLGSKIEA
jgi:large subunit ribosomal protein L23